MPIVNRYDAPSLYTGMAYAGGQQRYRADVSQRLLDANLQARNQALSAGLQARLSAQQNQQLAERQAQQQFEQERQLAFQADQAMQRQALDIAGNLAQTGMRYNRLNLGGQDLSGSAFTNPGLVTPSAPPQGDPFQLPPDEMLNPLGQQKTQQLRGYGQEIDRLKQDGKITPRQYEILQDQHREEIASVKWEQFKQPPPPFPPERAPGKTWKDEFGNVMTTKRDAQGNFYADTVNVADKEVVKEEKPAITLAEKGKLYQELLEKSRPVDFAGKPSGMPDPDKARMLYEQMMSVIDPNFQGQPAPPPLLMNQQPVDIGRRVMEAMQGELQQPPPIDELPPTVPQPPRANPPQPLPMSGTPEVDRMLAAIDAAPNPAEPKQQQPQFGPALAHLPMLKQAGVSGDAAKMIDAAIARGSEGGIVFDPTGQMRRNPQERRDYDQALKVLQHKKERGGLTPQEDYQYRILLAKIGAKPFPKEPPPWPTAPAPRPAPAPSAYPDPGMAMAAGV